MTVYIGCDAEGCTTFVRAQGILARDWLTITEGDTVIAHCCCMDHIMRYAANSEPIHEVML